MDDERKSYGQRLREKGVGLGAGTTPTRRRGIGDGRSKEHYNGWERGVARDDRGMPYLDETLNPIGNKQFAEGYRDKFAERDAARAAANLSHMEE